MYIVLICLAFCFSSFAGVEKLKEGMSEAEVVAIVKEPEDTHVDENGEKTLIYDKFVVGFKKQKVYEVFKFEE